VAAFNGGRFSGRLMKPGHFSAAPAGALSLLFCRKPVAYATG
jgi:hypothetical protein